MADNATRGSGPRSSSATLTIDELGMITAVDANPSFSSRHGKLRSGVRLADALDRIDTALAKGLQAATEQRCSLSGTLDVAGHGAAGALAYDLRLGANGDDVLELSDGQRATPDDLVNVAVIERRRTTALAQILSVLNRSVRPDEAARVALPLMVDALDVDTGALFVGSGDQTAELVFAYGPTRKRGYPYPALDTTDPVIAPLTRRPSVTTVKADERHRLQPALRAVLHPWFRAAYVASVFTGHAGAGFLAFSRRSSRALSVEQATFLDAVRDAMGLALGKAALSQQTDMSEAVLDTACAVARAISGSLDLGQTFTQIAASAARVIGDCDCMLLEVETASGDLVSVAASDPDGEALLGLRIRFEDAPSNREALQRRRSIVVEDVVWGAGTDHTYRKKLAIRSALFVPIHSEEGLIGSLLLYSHGRRESYSPQDVARAETVAEQAASAICNSRLFQDLRRSELRAQGLLERITQLREQQRVTFANVLHDDVVQTIVAALYELEGMRPELPDAMSGELERIADLLRTTITEARRVIWDLRPPVLDGLGLKGALSALAERTVASADRTVDVDLGDSDDLSSGITTALYMVAREALQNVRRHAGATHIELSLRPCLADERQRPAVRLRVADDGVGFDSAMVDDKEHFGLTMMDEQMAFVGGALTITSAPGAGTVVEATVPLPERSE